MRLIEVGGAVDLDERVEGQGLHREGGARGRVRRESCAVDLVHCFKVVHVGEEDGRLDNLGEVGAGLLENRPHVLHHLLGLCLDGVARELALARDQADLAGHVKGVAGLDRLRVRPERRGGLVGGDDLLAHGAHGEVTRDGRGGAVSGPELRGRAEERGGDGGHRVSGVLDSDE